MQGPYKRQKFSMAASYWFYASKYASKDIMRMRTPQKAQYVLSCFHNRYVADGQNYILNPLTLKVSGFSI